MILRIWINGLERLAAAVEPEQVQTALDVIDVEMANLAWGGGRVTVALDSDAHDNVTYILNRRRRR